MRLLISTLAGLSSLLVGTAVLAHHAFSAEFDIGRPLDLTGTVSAIEWTNPHAWLHLEVSTSDGQVQKWAVEMLGVITLAQAGFSRQTVKVGDRLTVTGFGSRDGTNTANASTIRRAETGELLWGRVSDSP